MASYTKMVNGLMIESSLRRLAAPSTDMVMRSADFIDKEQCEIAMAPSSIPIAGMKKGN